MAEKVDSTDEFLYCSCTSSKDNIEEYPELKAILPVDFKYTVCYWKKVEENHFESKFRVNVANVDDCYMWMFRFQDSSETKFRKNNSLRNFKEAFLVSLRCSQVTPVNKPPEDAPVKKDIDPSTIKPIVYFEKRCNTRLVVIVKSEGFSEVCDIPDVHLDEFPMTVIYHHLHNHPATASPCPNPSFVDTYMMSVQKRQILDEIREVERTLQLKACRDAGHDADKIFGEKYDPFSLESFRDALSSVNCRSKKSNAKKTDRGCLLHSGKDSYSKALDLNSLGEWLAVKGRSQLLAESPFQRKDAASASAPVADTENESYTDDFYTFIDNMVKKKEFTPAFRDELKERGKVSLLKKASSEDNASSESLSQFFSESKPQTEGATSALTSVFGDRKFPAYLSQTLFADMNTEIHEKLKKRLEASLLKDASSSDNASSDDNASSEGRSQFIPESKLQTEGADSVYMPVFDNSKFLLDFSRSHHGVMYTNTEINEELKKVVEAASLEDASSSDDDDISSESL